MLDRLLQYLPEVREVGGVRAIPYMQVHSVHWVLNLYNIETKEYGIYARKTQSASFLYYALHVQY